MIGANIRAAQRYQASGEATPQAQLPAEFVSSGRPSSPISDHLDTPTDYLSFYPGQPCFVVGRWPRMKGLRYQYALGHIRMPVKHLGANAIPRPENSAFQPNLHGPIHYDSFYDMPYYFETGGVPNGIGWPGRGNLALSFKVPSAEKNTAAEGPISHGARTSGPRSGRPQSFFVNKIRRPSGNVKG